MVVQFSMIIASNPSKSALQDQSQNLLFKGQNSLNQSSPIDTVVAMLPVGFRVFHKKRQIFQMNKCEHKENTLHTFVHTQYEHMAERI